jgi:hypothetical protein
MNGNEPAWYVIRVDGVINHRWVERLSGMQVTARGEHEAPWTDLYGELVDQSALLGVLNALYNLGLPLLLVRRVPGETCGGGTADR